MSSPDLEKTSLETHVTLCEMRYQTLEKRIGVLESKIEGLQDKINKFRLDFFKIMVGTAGSIIVALIGAVAAIKWH